MGKINCECGAEIAKSIHANWCPIIAGPPPEKKRKLSESHDAQAAWAKMLTHKNKEEEDTTLGEWLVDQGFIDIEDEEEII